ncbi:conserved hypothetical protein [Haloferula helveola]|uniref:Uncharacterized protein n=2 Tax=Haloferula helveola TaxID=490095 RepID=A0ABM7R7M3_9BACT|nr:conserved hypothetical protein [Haloferula helveola]
MKAAVYLLSAATFAIGFGIGWNGITPSEKPLDNVPIRPPKTDRNRSANAGPTRESGSSLNLSELDRILSETNPAERLRGLVRFANTIPLRDLPTWNRRGSLRSGDPLQDRIFREILTGRLTTTDRGRAIVELRGSDPKKAEAEFEEWMREDPERALRFLQNAHPSILESFSGAALKQWAASDPERALRIIDLSARKCGLDHSHQLFRELGSLAETHGDELIELSKGWPSHWRSKIQSRVAQPRWLKDPASTIAWMKEENMPPHVFSGMLSLIGDSTPWEKRGEVLKVLEHVKDMPPEWLEIASRSVEYLIVQGDMEGWLKATPSELGMSPALLEVYQLEAADMLQGAGDVDALMAAALTPKVQTALALEALERRRYDDLKGAAEWIATIPYPEARAAAQEKYDHYVELQKQRDENARRGPAVPDWGSWPPTFEPRSEPPSPGADPETARMQSLVAESRPWDSALKDVGPAYRHVLETDPGWMTDEITTRFVDTTVNWARENPSATANWATTLPPGSHRETVLRNVTRQWAARDPAGARRWVDLLADTADRELAMAELP